MTEQNLIFDRLIHYDPGQAGVTVEVSLSLSAVSVSFPAKSIQARAIAFSSAAMEKR
jgi:hypothetical protein